MVAGVRPGRSADQGLVVAQEATDDSPGGPPAHTGLEGCPVPAPALVMLIISLPSALSPQHVLYL